MAHLDLRDMVFGTAFDGREPRDPETVRADATRAEQALNRFLAEKQRLLFEAPDAFYRTEGEAAIHAAPPAMARLDALGRDLLAGLANAAQRRHLARALGAQRDLTRDAIGRHVAVQSAVWQGEVARDRRALLAKEAQLHGNDPALVEVLRQAAARLETSD
jgi:hypothetical protein